MRAIPLFDDTAAPDAWHDVRAPGGYEWWYFDAEDPATDTQVVAIFMQGFVFHPGYIRAIEQFRKSPTRTPPPLPAEWPCAYLCVYRGGAILHQFITQYAPEDFSAARDRTDVILGLNRLQAEDGALRLLLEGTPWRLTWRGPETLTQQTLTADLTFTPTFDHGPEERLFLSRAMTGADHHWVIAHPACRVEGVIELKGEATDRIAFTGRGYHDHNYGTGPLGPGLARWIWGRAILGDRVLTFHHAAPADALLPPETHLVEASAGGMQQIAVERVTADWSARTAVGLRYPLTLAFDEHLSLQNPRVIDSAPFYMRLVYDVVAGGESATAFCEVAYPHRLRWPILGRMIEMSIDKRTARDRNHDATAAR